MGPLCPLVSVSYAGDEFEARLVLCLWRQLKGAAGARAAGLWGSERRLEEVGHFGEAAKRGGVRVLDEPLLRHMIMKPAGCT